MSGILRCKIHFSVYISTTVKFGLSEKHSKFKKIFLMVLTNQLIYLVDVKTMRKIFSNYVCFSKSPNFMKANRLKIIPSWPNLLQVMIECKQKLSN